jgi:hypothetical protein
VRYAIVGIIGKEPNELPRCALVRTVKVEVIFEFVSLEGSQIYQISLNDISHRLVRI